VSKENDAKKNHFLDLVEKFDDVIEEKHLEMLLKSQLDSISQVYFWILTAFLAIGTAASATNIVIDPSSIWGYISLAFVIVLLIVFCAYGQTIKKIDLLGDKAKLVEKFLIAKRSLDNNGKNQKDPLKKRY
jgi:hypothetical protein